MSQAPEGNAHIGTLEYTNGTKSPLYVPITSSIQYGIQVAQQQEVPGVAVGSHRTLPNYQVVANIPTQVVLPESAFSAVNQEVMQQYAGGHTGYSPTYRMKEAIISMATFGPGNTRMPRNDVAVATLDEFISILRGILPESLGFVDLSIRTPDVVLVTRSGEFLIDAASGGLMALIDLAWRIFLFSRRGTSFVVTIDEPENHLHPSMQRSLVRSLLRTFPRAQFIIATHSPFIVSAVQDSNVYVLAYDRGMEGRTPIPLEGPDRRVVSIKLDTVNKAGTASEILRDVLGVRTTMPEWVEENLEKVVRQYREEKITAESLGNLRAKLDQLGYGELYPEALAELTRGR
jgi:hypothetical protein